MKAIVGTFNKVKPYSRSLFHALWNFKKIRWLFYNPQATVEEMYRGEFEVGSTKFTLDIEDTSGTFAWDFPAMVEVSL